MNTTIAAATVGAARHRPPDLFVTKATLERRKRVPNPHMEAATLSDPPKALTDDPYAALRHLLEIALHLCGAGTAALSLLRHDSSGQVLVHWEAISGTLARYEGTDTPRDCSPCGLCLDAGNTVVVSRPERSFDCLHDVHPPIAEDLIVPLYDNKKKPLGTLWIAHHDRNSHFSSHDARIVERLAVQLVLTLKLLELARERQHALALLESHHTAQRNLLVYDLTRERSLFEQAESASRQALMFKDAMLHEVNHRTKNTLQTAASLLSFHARATSSAPVRDALLESNCRLQLLAKAHELLYLDPDNTQTVLMSQLLQTLGDSLRQSFAGTSGQVELEFTADPIALPVEEAIPIALLANEAVTNAYKHAFPNGASGKIIVHLGLTHEGVLTLRIADTGIGLQLNGGEGGMGLKLIRILATQVRGTLDFSGQAGAGGTAITLTIPHSASRVG